MQTGCRERIHRVQPCGESFGKPDGAIFEWTHLGGYEYAKTDEEDCNPPGFVLAYSHNCAVIPPPSTCREPAATQSSCCNMEMAASVKGFVCQWLAFSSQGRKDSSTEGLPSSKVMILMPLAGLCGLKKVVGSQAFPACPDYLFTLGKCFGEQNLFLATAISTEHVGSTSPP